MKIIINIQVLNYYIVHRTVVVIVNDVVVVHDVVVIVNDVVVVHDVVVIVNDVVVVHDVVVARFLLFGIKNPLLLKTWHKQVIGFGQLMHI